MGAKKDKLKTIRKILLAGNPNVGKSAIFSRLTGAEVIISNYPGTTVEWTQGYLKLGRAIAKVVDVPGIYGLVPTNRAEEVAVGMLGEGDALINVVDATNLERNLYLTLQLLQKRVPMIVALNMWDDTRHKGIHINVDELERALGVPVVTTCGISGEGITRLVERIAEAKIPPGSVKRPNGQALWNEIGTIVSKVQQLTHRHHTLLERLEDLSIMPVSGIMTAAAVLWASFGVVRFIGEGLVSILAVLFERLWLPVIYKISALLGGEGIAHHILIGEWIGGKIDLGASFGLLTTGVYVPLGMILPYLFSFYLMLGVWEDFGYLPRLSVVMDNLMHRVGLHGYAIVPVMLGLGCNVPGIMAVRLLEGRREKFIAATLMAVAVPCMAELTMIVGLVGARGGRFLGIIFGVLFLVLIVKGVLLNKFLPGRSPEILIEIPPYRLPHPGAVMKKLWIRLKSFLKEAVPFVLLGVLLSNILYAGKILKVITIVFAPLFRHIWGLPEKAVAALILGFLRKDVAVAMLAPLNLTTKQLIIACMVLTLYFPCVATFMVLVKELGIKDMLKSAALMLLTAVAVGWLLNVFWVG